MKSKFEYLVTGKEILGGGTFSSFSVRVEAYTEKQALYFAREELKRRGRNGYRSVDICVTRLHECIPAPQELQLALF